MARIRTLEFLPEVFQTPSNAEFLAASLDQIVNPPVTTKIQGYVGSKLGYGINANDYYVSEPTKTRVDYQLEPGVVFTKPNESIVQDFITYPGIIDALKIAGGQTNQPDRMFQSEFYSWDSFTNLDKLVNFNEYYWLPFGPPAVTVSTQTVFSSAAYRVTNNPNNTYSIIDLTKTGTNQNPMITLLRGGTYTFLVDQESQFFIQSEPGTSGTQANHPNVPTRNVFGVENNGATTGLVTFNVPQKDAQNEFIFDNSNVVDLVSTKPFNQVNGVSLNDLGNIDGVTSLEGLRVIFYNTGIPNEIGYVSQYFGEDPYDVNSNVTVPPLTVSVGSCDSTTFTLTTGDTSTFTLNQTITFNSPGIGGVIVGRVYYIKDIIDSTRFTISQTVNGPVFSLTPSSPTQAVIANVNQGLLEEGYYTNVAEHYYRITYVGASNNPEIRLVPDGLIPLLENIVPIYGDQWNSRPFYRNVLGVLNLVPQITAPLDTLYYQDGTSATKVGRLKIIDNNTFNDIDVVEDILGQPNYISPNGVTFTNGLKVMFDGKTFPESYLNGEYYVEGVGTGIELIPVESLVCPEKFTEGNYIPWDSTGFDIGSYDIELFVPVLPDYITIARNAINRNAWSRSNRWFHADVINATAEYNNNPSILTEFANGDNKAKRPIIEFYPNLKLFNSGTIGTKPVDFFDTRVTDALSTIPGSKAYYPDVETYTTYTATINDTLTAPQLATALVPGETYVIDSLGTTDWNVVAGTQGEFFVTGQRIVCVAPGTGNGTAILLASTTTVQVAEADVTGVFQLGMYVGDTEALLPENSYITAISGVGTGTLTLTVVWPTPQNILTSTTTACVVGTDTTTSNYAVFTGSRIVFAADTDTNTFNKIYVVDISELTPGQGPVITLSLADDGNVQTNEQVVVSRGYNYQGKSFYFTGLDWLEAQQKVTVNQPPLFDVFDENGISFGDDTVYNSTSFKGCKLFAYGINELTIDDPILGFPIRYSSIDNVGDISFDVSLNLDTFNYVSLGNPITQKVNTGYVYNYPTPTAYTRQLGWQTAVAPSTQYQAFNFSYKVGVTSNYFSCDIPKLPDLASGEEGWPTIQVYVNNIYLNPSDYAVYTDATSTAVVLNNGPEEDTVVQILLLSDQVSPTAYYTVPINLNNNPLNQDLTTANIGDIRMQYRDIFINSPDTTGAIFGSNNYRDLGNLVPYGTKIIQNSASLVLPGTFLRKQNHDLFNALLFNSREYVKFKQLLVDTVNTTDYAQRFTPSEILDIALDQISAARSQTSAFFWSDMVPSKSAYVTNVYTFANSLDTSIYPLTHVYNFGSANYDGVLVYLIRTVNGIVTETQLLKGVDYIVSSDSPSLTVTLDLLPGDKIVIKEYNQTYGSYVPNTPTKLGLYQAYEPRVVYETDYFTPTYFILGHDGSYTKLYGEFDETTGLLIDFRDQALLEFERRIYNNLKLSTEVPIKFYDVLPGYFRESDYSWDDWLAMYTPNFLDWIGQNRLDYKTQFYSRTNEFTYNYTNSGNKLDKAPIQQGYWRGVYEYFYDTFTPNLTPWEMLGFANEPDWWVARYGPAPYTSDNGILWADLEAGLVWNNGNPVIVPELARPGLSQVIPVDSNGELLSPLTVVVGNYNPSTFQKDWKVGDVGPVELSYRRSSTWPFDLVRLFALTRPAEFYNLAVDLDNYKYNAEFNQYLVNNRNHLNPTEIQVYGNGTAKTSYINWIVDYEKQLGIDATANITDLLKNLDVRLVYRLAGYSDKSLLKFYVEKGSPNSRNASLLIPDESYQVLLYDNQPFDKVMYSSLIVQSVNGGWTVHGNSQTFSYFTVKEPIYNGKWNNIDTVGVKVKIATDYSDNDVLVPYGTKFYSIQEVCQFIASYGAWAKSKGLIFDEINFGQEINWDMMIREYIYWTQTGWEESSVITLNPASTVLKVDRENAIVQPLTMQQQNFILNQNLYPIQMNNVCVQRDGTLFRVHTLNQGDSFSYTQFNLSNFEHGIVFDNVTLFNDVIYNLVTGLRQNRIAVRGTKTAEWNGTVNASGFILNQDNVVEWSKEIKYTKGSIVKYKNKYWTALKIVEPAKIFNELEWKEIDYQDVQKGLLPNASTRAYESTLYYNTEEANLEQDADLLSYSLIGYRPRDYLALADLSDTTQVNVYKNMIKDKGTRNATNAFKGANLPQGGIDYNIYENWAIKSGEYGGVLNENFVEFKLNQPALTGNPSIVSLTDGIYTPGSMQEVTTYNLYNYGRPIESPNILNTLTESYPIGLYPTAGYVNFDDVKMASYYYAGLPSAINSSGTYVPIDQFYVRDYLWLANFKEKWGVYTWKPIAQVTQVRGNINNTATVTFDKPHGLKKLDPIAIINFSPNVNGYYIVSDVVNINQIIINLTTLGNNTTALTGRGIGMQITSQRVPSPADIAGLDLIEAEFIKNTVWVDENTDGDWAVYRKNINYQLQDQLSRPADEYQVDYGVQFGASVAYNTIAGQLVGDPGVGSVYRYTYNDLTKTYEPVETLSQNASFGSKIVYANNIYVISEPTSVTPKVYIYTINDSIISDDMIPYQLTDTSVPGVYGIEAPLGVTDWGSELAISDDGNWIYISDIEHDQVYVYRRENITFTAGYFEVGETYVINELGDTDFEAIGAVENKVGIAFIATGVGSGTGTATQSSYKFANIISNPEITVAGSFIIGEQYIIKSIGTTDFTLIGAASNTVGLMFTATDSGSGTGTATQYGKFGTSIATNYSGDLVVIGAPNVDYSETINDWGSAYVYQRQTQNFESQYTSDNGQPHIFQMAWNPTTLDVVVTATGGSPNYRLTCDDTTGMYVGQPVLFSGSSFANINIETLNTVYYINNIVNSTQFTIAASRESTTLQTQAYISTPVVATTIVPSLTYQINTIGSTDWTLVGAASNTVGEVFTAYAVGTGTGTATPVMVAHCQTDPLYVTVNGKGVDDSNYALVEDKLYYIGSLKAGDIVNISSTSFRHSQTVTSKFNDRTDIQFGYDLDCDMQGSSMLIGSPFEVDENNVEGAAYNYINGGSRYGVVIGTGECNITSPRNLQLNGYLIQLQSGNAEYVADTINQSNITNISATATVDNKIIIQTINNDLTVFNEKLVVGADVDTLSELGITLFTNTQIIKIPHVYGQSQFGKAIKINDRGSALIAAPVGTRFEGTTFDFTDDENLDNDTVFDNNATRFVDQYANAGAVYMFDYLGKYNESLVSPGAYVFAQSVNNRDTTYGNNPLYGYAIEFNDNVVMVGAPNFIPNPIGGIVTVFNNQTGQRDWTEFRQSCPIVDIEKIQNTQIFSASTNDTLVNLDYMDPLQGKLLGAVRQNIDYVSGVDPARYNSDRADQTGYYWGAEHVGQVWLNTNNLRFMNYHQNDVVYNSRYWGSLFPGSDIAVYTWVASNTPPNSYQGPGTPYNIGLYCVGSTINASGVVVPVYYFWARNTNLISQQREKTLSDYAIANYIANPKSSGVAYMAPLLPNTYALYNCGPYINANDSVFHLGYANGVSNDVAHQEFTLIRENYPDDFLPGLPSTVLLHASETELSGVNPQSGKPYGLYDRLLDSLSGCDEVGAVVPNPWLPKAVQSGVLVRPRQSFFYDRLEAVKNYLIYANDVLEQFPIAETRPNATFLFESNEFFNTQNYWEFINWWAAGYDNNTKTTMQVPIYADLIELNVAVDTLVTVQQNGDGKFEVYRYDGNGVWTRVGLENGTIKFKTYLWDYNAAKLGYSGDFFDTTAYDTYPSEETRYIVRALNEQIYIDELVEFRNKSLIILFEYIQSETTESQNYLPWLSKTSLVDVEHTIRELIPVEVFQSDNQEFLSGYINEVKPYHVVIKEFSFNYTGQDTYEGTFTDFDLPATYNPTYQEYISPQLVYGGSNSRYEYTLTDDIWNNSNYTEWFNNYGVSITGKPNYPITTIASFLGVGSNFIIVDNAYGFPTSGIITIGEEQISYSGVDRSLNLLTGLVRGINLTTISDHVPGEQVFIDLPGVVVLDGGRNYSEPPRVTAYTDPAYPAPRIPAEFEVVMSGDKVLFINVVPGTGEGYKVLPEIIVEASETVNISSSDINEVLHTIKISASDLQTGDLVKFKAGINGVTIGKLENNQWYYVGILENSPSTIVAFYTSYGNAVRDQDRIPIFVNGTSNDMSINAGAKAYAVTSSSPTRENITTLRFDRTTYTSQVKDWEESAYYGSFFAGDYNNSQQVSSSSLTLENVNPDISTILAGAQGVALEITDVGNDQTIDWSSALRYVGSTEDANDALRLLPQDGNNDPLNPEPNAQGTTLGFYTGMPVKFSGVMLGGIVAEQTYYVKDILNDLDFTISATYDGPTLSLTDGTLNYNGMVCYVGEVTNTAILTVNYPGILTVTAATSGTNTLTVPMTLVGTGGTKNFYTNLPIFFTDMMVETPQGLVPTNTFGGLVENTTYYVTTVVDDQTFTIAKTQNPITVDVTQTIASNNSVVVSDTSELSVNDPIIFSDLTDTLIGSGIVAGQTYYVSQVLSGTAITLSESINGNTHILVNGSGTGICVSQKDVITLTDEVGAATMNVSLPVSPGQVDGQLFTLYSTSGQYPGINYGDVSDLIERTVNATISTVNRIAIPEIENGTAFFYKNMPVSFSPSIGGLTSGTTYYIVEYSGMEDPLNPGEYLTNIKITVTSSSSVGNKLTCDTTASLYVGMPVVFSGIALGGINIGQQYFVNTIVNGTQFTIRDTADGSTALTLSNSSGIMVGTGDPYIKVSTTPNGSPVTLSTVVGGSVMTQDIQSAPTFDISYVLGGYRAIIVDGGAGFAINNTITIAGSEVGGVSPANDVILTVNTIDETNGAITDVICAGTVPGISNQYYMRVISPNQFAVYSNPLMTVPVSGLDFAYTGFTTDTVTNTNDITDALTISDTGKFDVYDAVVFTGDTNIGVTNIVPGQTYYIYDILSSTEFTISSVPGDVTTLVTMDATTSGNNFTMAKMGSIALLPEPFFFNQSIVKFNNRVYSCIISNNDKEFILGKWRLLDSGDRKLNALDRTIGYYQPTVDMPGVDLTQLFEGVTYPNSIYYGNRFQPNEQFEVDTILSDQPFYPTGVDLTGIVWDGTKYVSCANLPTYTGIAISEDGNDWSLGKLTNAGVGATDIVYNNGIYVMTSQNSATPIFRSQNGISWTTNGYYTPYGSLPYDESPYDTTSLSVSALALNAAVYHNNRWYAVGENIISSNDTFIWNEVTNFDPVLDYNLYGVTSAYLSSFIGIIAVGTGKRVIYNPNQNYIDTSVIAFSSDGVIWSEISGLTDNGLYGVASDGSGAIAIGDHGVRFYTNNGYQWYGMNEAKIVTVNSGNDIIQISPSMLQLNQEIKFNNTFSSIVAGTTYYVNEIISPTLIKISDTPSGSVKTLTAATVPTDTILYSYDLTTPTVRDLIYANGVWVAVGDLGLIITSTDGITWVEQTSNTGKNLRGVNFNSSAVSYIAVGDGNAIIVSEDNGVTWTSVSLFQTVPTLYDVQGAPFEYGYGPEELVPGNITDNMSMIVSTRPGTNWPVTEYGHTGFNVTSIEVAPTSGTQTVYSFENVADTPAQIYVQVLDAITGLGTTLPKTEYTVDWVNKNIILDTPISFSPLLEKLRIDVYEVGNSDQLVKASTDILPIRTNSTSGFNEIYVNCNYSAPIFQGSGVIRPGTYATLVEAIATDSDTDTIVCVDVSNMVVNSPISFQGVLFGGVAEETTYYIKSISAVTKSITISDSYNLITGTAGPTFQLTTATGSMYINLSVGNGQVWSEPIMYHNGTQLVLGTSGIVTKSSSVTNTLTTSTTSGLIVNTPITFCECIFGNVIQPMVTYYIKTIVDANEFTISQTPGGPVFPLSDETGGSLFVTNDYAFGIQPNGTQAKIIFAHDSYSNDTDYIVFSLFGETAPEQYGYSLPQVQEFVGNGSSASFNLNNFVGSDNPQNAIVEVNGLRLTLSQYDIDPGTNTILFFSPPPANSTISVTTYNDTNRQYLVSQYGITGSPDSALETLVIGSTTALLGSYDQDSPTAITYDQDTPSVVPYDAALYWMTLSSGNTSSLNVGDPVVFQAPVIGGVVAGRTYYIVEIINSTDFSISETIGGPVFELTTDSGSMNAIVNGLNVAPIESINNTIATPLAVTNATATSSLTDIITVQSTSGFVQNQTAQFYGTSFDTNILTDGTVYFVRGLDPTTFVAATEYTISSLGDTDWNAIGFVGTPSIGATFIASGAGTGTGEAFSNTEFRIADFDGNIIPLSGGSGVMPVVIGASPAVRVTTATQNGFVENTLVRMDGILGSTQLNGNVYYAKIITPYTFDLYTQPYSPTINAINSPVTSISSYQGGGYAWRAGLFYLSSANVISTTYGPTVTAGSFVIGVPYTITTVGNTNFTTVGATSNEVGTTFVATGVGTGTGTATPNYITAESTENLVVGNSIYFNKIETLNDTTLASGLVSGQKYYVKEIFSLTEFSVSETRNGPAVQLITSTEVLSASQWEQYDVDRLWVTVNGYRVPSSKLKINQVNEISILTEIVTGDQVTITSMIPTATPDEEIYINFVDTQGQASVYKETPANLTWLVDPIFELTTAIKVNDVSKITETLVQNATVPAQEDGYYYIGMIGDKNIYVNVTVYNNTTNEVVNSDFYNIIAVDLSPTLQIDLSAVSQGDELTITILQGNLIFVNGEFIGFGSVDVETNTLGQLSRGANGTGKQYYIPANTKVFGLLTSQKMPDVYYGQTWNSAIYNTVDGDPLQISQTIPADFLKVDVA